MEEEIVKKFFFEFDNFAQSLLFYNEFSYGTLFSNLTENKMQENIIGTYQNIFTNQFLNNHEFTSILNKMYKQFCRIIKLYNKHEENDFIIELLDLIKEKYLKKEILNFYEFFCFFSDCVELLKTTNNLLYLFLYNISYAKLKKETPLTEGRLFVQRIIILLREILFIHWKKKNIMKKLLIKTSKSFINNL